MVSRVSSELIGVASIQAPSAEIRGLDPMAAADAPLRRGLIRRNLAWVLFLLVLAVFTAGRLVGPRVPESEQKHWCAVNIHITALLGVSLNCDSPEFMRVAAHPELLLGTTTPMQSRPGMPALAWLISRPLQPLAALVPRLVDSPQRADIDPGRISDALQSFGPEYAAYVLLNLLILGASFFVFRLVYRRHQPTDRPEAVAIVAVSFATLMVATYPVTSFLLTPHSQLFNTLTPLLALLFALRANEGALADVRFAVMVGAIVGFGQTAYANFLVITMAVLLFAALHALGRWRDGERRIPLGNAALLLVLSVAPILLWYAFVRLAGGEFHYHEFQHDKSVAWMLDALQESPARFWSELVRRFDYQWAGLISLLSILELMAVAVVGFLIAAAVGLKRDRIVVPLLRDLRSTLGIALVVGFMFFAFYLCVGQFQVRLEYAALPPVVAGGGALATALAGRLPTGWRRSFGAMCAAIALLALTLAFAEGIHVQGGWFD
jgi:hypothetical protein